MMRDPRDNFASYRKNQIKTNHDLDIKHFCMRWALSYELGKIAQKRIKNYHVLRYEDLVSNPRKTLEKVSTWLSIDFNESLLEPTLAGMPWLGNAMRGYEFSGVAKKSIGCYKEMLAKKETQYIEKVLCPYLVQLGYSTDTARAWNLDYAEFKLGLFTRKLKWMLSSS
jgi:hypothetical protein